MPLAGSSLRFLHGVPALGSSYVRFQDVPQIIEKASVCGTDGPPKNLMPHCPLPILEVPAPLCTVATFCCLGVGVTSGFSERFLFPSTPPAAFHGALGRAVPLQVAWAKHSYVWCPVCPYRQQPSRFLKYSSCS